MTRRELEKLIYGPHWACAHCGIEQTIQPTPSGVKVWMLPCDCGQKQSSHFHYTSTFTEE